MFQKEELAMNDLSGRKIAYEVSEKYSSGLNLLIGENDSLEFLKSIHETVQKSPEFPYFFPKFSNSLIPFNGKILKHEEDCEKSQNNIQHF